MSRPDRTNLDKRSTAELLSMLEEYCLRRAETKTAKEANKWARALIALSEELQSRGPDALAELMEFVETASPEAQIWAVRDLMGLYPVRIRQILYCLTEHTGDVSINAKLFLKEMG